mmetsp:Transcript_3002/g.10827  ORF Transcript_3002/g.10827 Transcript_3002/m.10827 type:complete len:101 (-) Transcript_3002:1531-1833(-)
MAFFKALGGGRVHSASAGGVLFGALNPFSKMSANFKRTNQKNIKGNFKGEGLILGGLYVVNKNGEPEYVFREEIVGDHAPLSDIMDAVGKVAQNAAQEGK